jgi:hypothetical protein
MGVSVQREIEWYGGDHRQVWNVTRTTGNISPKLTSKGHQSPFHVHHICEPSSTVHPDCRHPIHYTV